MIRRASYNTATEDGFYRELNTRIHDYFKASGRSTKGNWYLYIKICICLTLFALLYLLIISNKFSIPALLLLTLAFGVVSALVGFNIGHDAVHDALFKSAKLNRVFRFAFELVGMSSYTWYIKHNVVHHNNPNVQAVDFDIEGGPLLRLSPKDKLRRFHTFQHFYAPFIYTLFSLVLIFVNDFLIVFNTPREYIDGKKHPVSEKLIMIISKLFYVTIMLVIPILVLDLRWWQVLVGFLCMHAVLSVLMAFVLIPAHIFEETRFAEKDESGTIHTNWARHQLETTIDYSRKSRICNMLLGGLNVNVVHHLFPHVSHVHLIPLSDIVKKTAEEYDIKYNEASLGEAIVSHFRALKMLGMQKNFRHVLA